MKRRTDNLRKRCTHAAGAKNDAARRRAWAKCSCPWHFYARDPKRRAPDNEIRVSINRYAELPANHPMSRGDAEGWRDRILVAIGDGTFRMPGESEPIDDTRLTFNDVADRYEREHVHTPGRRKGAIATMLHHIAVLRRTEIPAGKGQMIAFGTLRMADITAADVEALRTARRDYYRTIAEQAQRAADAEAAGTPMKIDRRALRIRAGVKSGEVGINRLFARLRHIFAFAVQKDIVPKTPFRREGVTMVKLATAFEKARTRRLTLDEEDRLKRAAGSNPHLLALIVAGLETGCRLGELLSLQWRDVMWGRNAKGEPEMRALMLSASKTKTGDDRTIPVSDALRGVLEMRRHVPAEPPELRETLGDEYGPDCCVFGDALGEPIKSIRKAWHGACRRAKIVDLHFHDLRREFASRFLESGAATLADVQHTLGHANISMTSRYLKVTHAGLQKAFTRFDQARTAVESSPTDAARTNCAQDGNQPLPPDSVADAGSAPNRLM